MSNDLHLGLTPWHLNAALDADTLCEQAEQAERWGYDSFFLPENHFTGSASIPDPLLLLAAVAARTQTITLGTTSWLLPIRNALLAAEQAAVLDNLCKGRLILGLGRGFQPGMLEAFGVNIRDKREKFAEILDAMLAAWRGEFVGSPERLMELTPLPLQQPHPPLWVAAFGPKAIAQVAALGLPYLASPLETFEELQENFGRHGELMEAAGHQALDTVAVMRTVFISDDDTRCEQVRDKMADSQWRGWCMIGSSAEVEEQLALYRQQLGMTHLIAVMPRVSGIREAWNRESLAQLIALKN